MSRKKQQRQAEANRSHIASMSTREQVKEVCQEHVTGIEEIFIDSARKFFRYNMFKRLFYIDFPKITTSLQVHPDENEYVLYTTVSSGDDYHVEKKVINRYEITNKGVHSHHAK